jgi:cysteine synthase
MKAKVMGTIDALPTSRHNGLRPTAPVGDLVGNTPVLWVPDLSGQGRHGFWAKLEGFNPGGLKDRAALYMVEHARQRGELRPGATIVESTSGTFGLGLALAGIVHGHPVHLVTDPGLEPALRRALAAYGAAVDIVDRPHPVGGWQQARRDRVSRLRAEMADAWCPDQYSNPDGIAGYASLAQELVHQVGRPDVLVCSVGTGGHSAGLMHVLRQEAPRVRLIGVDSVGSTIFGQPTANRLMRGLGSSIHPRNVAYPQFSEVHWVAPGEAVWACRQLAANHFISGGWSVGAVALVASWAARTMPDQRLVAIFPDGPNRYLDTIFSDEFCWAHQLDRITPALQPDEIDHPSQHLVTRWTRCTRVVDPLADRRRR